MSQYLYVLYILWALRHTFGIQLILPLENQKPKHTTQPEQCEGGKNSLSPPQAAICGVYSPFLLLWSFKHSYTWLVFGFGLCDVCCYVLEGELLC